MKTAMQAAAILALLSIAISTPAFVWIKDRNDKGVMRATQNIADELHGERFSKLPYPSLSSMRALRCDRPPVVNEVLTDWFIEHCALESLVVPD